jgi:hypothetical protein
MLDAEFLQRKLREVADARREAAQRQLDDAALRVTPTRGSGPIDVPDVDLVLAEFRAALDDMARFYLRLCETERERPTAHMQQFETEAAAAGSLFAQLWYAAALIKTPDGSRAERDVDVLFDELQERAAEAVRDVTKDVERGYVGQERVYSLPPDAPKPTARAWSPIVEKVTVDLLAKIVVGVLVAAGGALIVYLRVF